MGSSAAVFNEVEVVMDIKLQIVGEKMEMCRMGVMQISGFTGKTNERGMSDYVRYACSKYINVADWRS